MYQDWMEKVPIIGDINIDDLKGEQKMDLDNEELKTTRNKNEKKADDMFEELGYEYIINEMCVSEYRKYFELKRARHIIFAIDKTISVCEENEKALAVNRDYFNMQELQAINKKVEELGWR